jgi:hypothetical protein
VREQSVAALDFHAEFLAGVIHAGENCFDAV